MSVKIRKRTTDKKRARFKHKLKIRSKIWGTAERPRLAVFRSNAHLQVQLVDDEKGHTLASASTMDQELRGKVKSNVEGAKSVGGLLAKKALAKKVSTIVFDRGGYVYHGRVKAIADAAREGGLKF